jgi:hypothetical protein
MSVDKSTNHVGFEGSHCWAMLFYVEKEVCVPIIHVVNL